MTAGNPTPNETRELIAEARVYEDALQGNSGANWIRLVELTNKLATAIESLSQTPEEEWGYQLIDYPDEMVGPYKHQPANAPGYRLMVRSVSPWLPVEGEK